MNLAWWRHSLHGKTCQERQGPEARQGRFSPPGTPRTAKHARTFLKQKASVFFSLIVPWRAWRPLASLASCKRGSCCSATHAFSKYFGWTDESPVHAYTGKATFFHRTHDMKSKRKNLKHGSSDVHDGHDVHDVRLTIRLRCLFLIKRCDRCVRSVRQISRASPAMVYPAICPGHENTRLMINVIFLWRG
jgi:hypothetical protein